MDGEASMNDRLNKATKAYLAENGSHASAFGYILLSDNGCGEAPTVDVVYTGLNGERRTHEIRGYELDGFLTFLAEFEL